MVRSASTPRASCASLRALALAASHPSVLSHARSRRAQADSPSSGNGSPNDRTSGRQYQVSVKGAPLARPPRPRQSSPHSRAVLEASLGTKLSTYVEVALNSEKKRCALAPRRAHLRLTPLACRTRTIDSSDSPAWSETLDLCAPAAFACPAHDPPCSAVADSKWRVKFTLADASGAVLGVLALKASELELNPMDPEWFNLEGSAAARISVIVQQREAMCDPPVPRRDPRPRRSPCPPPVQ